MSLNDSIAASIEAAGVAPNPELIATVTARLAARGVHFAADAAKFGLLDFTIAADLKALQGEIQANAGPRTGREAQEAYLAANGFDPVGMRAADKQRILSHLKDRDAKKNGPSESERVSSELSGKEFLSAGDRLRFANAKSTDARAGRTVATANAASAQPPAATGPLNPLAKLASANKASSPIVSKLKSEHSRALARAEAATGADRLAAQDYAAGIAMGLRNHGIVA